MVDSEIPACEVEARARVVDRCPNCRVAVMEVFYELSSAPVNSCILLDSREGALNYPTGDIALGFCSECGFVSNAAFDPTLTEYSERYEETQGFSPTFRAFHRDLAANLIERYDLHDKDIIEIGCGKGEFLILLCELGNNRGTGFDPAYVEDRNRSDALERITFIRDFFSETYSHHHGDFVCCKMTLEHIHATEDFVSMMRQSIGNRPDTVVFFQVPEATRILRDCAFEDIYYEHCSYFSPGSLARLFRKSGFDILDISTEYDAQYLTIEAKPGNGVTQDTVPAENDLDAVSQYIAQFPEKFSKKQNGWNHRFNEYRKTNRKVVLWGSGSKAVSFLTTLNVSDAIEYVVDINPYRQGFFVPGTGQRIVAPEFLREYQPDVVVVMNRIYSGEIRSNLEQMGLAPEIVVI